MKTVLRIAFTFLFTVVMVSVADAQSAPFKEMTREQFNNLTVEQVNYLKTNGIEVKIIGADGTVSQTMKAADINAGNDVSSDDFSGEPVGNNAYNFESTGSEAGDIAKKKEIMESIEGINQERMENAPDAEDRPGYIAPQVGSGNPNGVPDYMIETPAAPQQHSMENLKK